MKMEKYKAKLLGIFDLKIVEILDRLLSENTLNSLHEAREAKQMFAK